jgi:hypothetical protein
MPTMTGSIWGQNVGYREVSDPGSNPFIDEVTLNLSFRDVTADAAISLLSRTKRAIWAECGFSMVNSLSNGIEEFNPAVPRIVRKGVAFITFRTVVCSCQVRSRWVINYWQQMATAAVDVAETELQTTDCFVAYDANSGEVVYVHEVKREPGAKPEAESPANTNAIRHMVAREFAGRRLEVIEAPKGFQRRTGVSYRVDPASKTIEPLEGFASFRDFVGQPPVD